MLGTRLPTSTTKKSTPPWADSSRCSMPSMIAFLGAVVGGIVISMYLPIFDLISKLT